MLGLDVSGVVESVGAEVTWFKVGDAVFGASSRTFAEFTCAREDQLCAKPERLSFEQAAAAAISGVTALIGLCEVAKLNPGQSVCVIGAGGGVGSWAVQLARHFGAHVTAVCNTLPSRIELPFVRAKPTEMIPLELLHRPAVDAAGAISGAGATVRSTASGRRNRKRECLFRVECRRSSPWGAAMASGGRRTAHLGFHAEG